MTFKRRKRKTMAETQKPERNWAGNYTYRAEKLHRPTTIEQVQEIVANAASVHALGSRHSFNDIADASELISLENLPSDVVVDHEAQTVSWVEG
jgi:xylitol oxidase